MTTPRTAGRQPMRRLCPAPPIFWFSCSTLPSCPTVARHRTWTTRMPPDGRRICAYSPSFATSWAIPPAARTSCAPRPGWSSTPWIVVPVGMFSSGRQLPTRASASGPDITVSPTLSAFGADWRKRRTGVNALYCFSGIGLDPFHEVALDLLALGDRHDRFLPVRTPPAAAAEPALLAADGHR